MLCSGRLDLLSCVFQRFDPEKRLLGSEADFRFSNCWLRHVGVCNGSPFIVCRVDRPSCACLFKHRLDNQASQKASKAVQKYAALLPHPFLMFCKHNSYCTQSPFSACLVCLSATLQGILEVLKWELPAEQFDTLCNMSQQATVPLAERAVSSERSYSNTYY